MAAITSTTTTTSTTAAAEPAVASAKAKRKRPSLQKRLAVIGSSIAVSLVFAEAMASLVHHRAFPYLNIFQADPNLGVRLQPNTTTRIRSRSGRTTDIRTNALGYRGEDWAAVVPSSAAAASQAAAETPRVVLLGDSQMFGYNVAEEVALASQIDRSGHYKVLNAAVPTWGPPDYVIALREIAPKYKPRFVLFVANAANDWFEPVPNRRRTTAVDGWVTRAASPMPSPSQAQAAQPQWFPFREWVMSRSHLVFGVRQVTSYVGSEGQPASSQSAVRLKTDLRMLRRGTSVGSGVGPSAQHYRSTITPNLKAAADACASEGCEVIAVALPCDVQVSASEWSKYRGAAPPVDLTDTELLLEDFVADARDLGIRAVNLIAPLRAAEPGAFLDDDYHLSPRGHRTVADALLPILDEQQQQQRQAGEHRP